MRGGKKKKSGQLLGGWGLTREGELGRILESLGGGWRLHLGQGTLDNKKGNRGASHLIDAQSLFQKKKKKNRKLLHGRENKSAKKKKGVVFNQGGKKTPGLKKGN